MWVLVDNRTDPPEVFVCEYFDELIPIVVQRFRHEPELQYKRYGKVLEWIEANPQIDLHVGIRVKKGT